MGGARVMTTAAIRTYQIRTLRRSNGLRRRLGALRRGLGTLRHLGAEQQDEKSCREGSGRLEQGRMINLRDSDRHEFNLPTKRQAGIAAPCPPVATNESPTRPPRPAGRPPQRRRSPWRAPPTRDIP